MDPVEPLDKFRNEWKNELDKKRRGDRLTEMSPGNKASATKKSKSTRSITLDDRPIAGSSSFQERDVKATESSPVFCHKCLQNQTVNTKKSGRINYLGSDSDSESTLTHYPFNIVDNLLNKSNPSRSDRAIPDEDMSDPPETKSAVTDKCGNCGASVHHDPRDAKKSPIKKTKNFVKERIEDVFKRNTKRAELLKESLLDQFLLDLNEIDEIPFFDISLPREVAVKIFRHLDMKDLCRCSQVSKSWRSLAEDELLWCNICHGLGYEQYRVTKDRGQWKAVVRENVTKDQQVLSNWKNRHGNLRQLQYVQGGILRAVDSNGDTVVAGYSNGEVKMWDLNLEESCTFKPSNTSLIINERQEEGTISIDVAQVAVTPSLAVARYMQGHIDIWKLNDDNDISPVFTVERHASGQPHVFCVARSCDRVVTGNAMDVSVYTCTPDGFQLHSLLNRYSGDRVSHLNMLEVTGEDPQVFVTTGRGEVYLHRPGETAEEMREYPHPQSGGVVSCVDVRVDPALIAVGQALTGTVYDIETAKTVGTLSGHRHIITSLNLVDSPPYQIVTGCMDRRVRIYDLRTDMVTTVLSGHTNYVTTTQMDDWKVVSGDGGGFVCVWDRRMATKLWEWHNRHPVRYCHFNKRRLIAANVPGTTTELGDDNIAHRRFRGCLHICDFSADQTAEGLPEICQSTYDEPEAYNYNIRLAVPYDDI